MPCRPARWSVVSLARMATWPDVRTVLDRLSREDPCPLVRSPDHRLEDGPEPPFEVGLAAWAVGLASDLHDEFGDDLDLTVGAMRYPDRVLSDWAIRPSLASIRVVDPAEASIRLAGPLAVRSGFATRHTLLVVNHTRQELQVRMGTALLAEVVDPATGTVVGGRSGPVFAVATTIRVAPRRRGRIPLRVGTDSFEPSLGYAVPPGTWGVQATLDPAISEPVRTPVLPITVTP
jgi:hypothetical protein